MSGMLEQLGRDWMCRSRRARRGGWLRCRAWIKAQTARSRRREARRAPEDAEPKRYRGWVS